MDSKPAKEKLKNLATYVGQGGLFNVQLKLVMMNWPRPREYSAFLNPSSVCNVPVGGMGFVWYLHLLAVVCLLTMIH